VSTQNRFSAIESAVEEKSIEQDNNKSGVGNNTNGKEPGEDRKTAPKKINTPDRDVEIIMDSHGNGMRASKLYKNRNFKLSFRTWKDKYSGS